jgi:hypothetical protein
MRHRDRETERHKKREAERDREEGERDEVTYAASDSHVCVR